jgi:multiple sugar transport system substrate-binding protein
VQGFAIYFNKDIYTQAGLDPENPPATWTEMVAACEAIKTKTGKACFAFGDKEGWNADWWLSVMLNGLFTPEEAQAWVNGEMKMTDPKPQKALELLAEAAKLGWFPEGAASTAMFPDSFEIFERGDAAHVIGLTSDVANWKEFADFLGDKNLGVTKGLIIDETVFKSIDELPFVNSAGIGFAVTSWSPHQEMATEFVKHMASKENLQNYHLYAAAMVSRKDFDTGLISSAAGKRIVEWAAGQNAATFHQWMPQAVAQEHERQGQLLLTGATTPADAAAAIHKVWDAETK